MLSPESSFFYIFVKVLLSVNMISIRRLVLHFKKKKIYIFLSDTAHFVPR